MTAAPRRRIGLFGGSFDPPHLAHLALGQVAQATLALDGLHWIPAGAPWQKADHPLAPGHHRAAMLRLLIGAQPGWCVDERELRRPGPTYTLDTVNELRAEQPDADLFLIIGQDQYGRLDSWAGWQQLLQRVTLAVAARDGQAPQPAPGLAVTPHAWQVLDLPRLDIAARDIRQRLAQHLPVAALVGEAVAGYIDRHGLYRRPD